MAAIQSTGGETSTPQQSMTMIPVDNLVPLDTQLITPALADAFDLPYASVVTSKEPQSKDAPQGKEFPANDYPVATHTQTQAPSQNAAQQNPTSNMKQPSDFNYQRNLYSNAQQPLMGNFFPQQSPANLAQQGGYPLDTQDHHFQGLFPSQSGLSGPQLPPGYAGMSPQFNGWMDPSIPGHYAQPSNPGKHTHEANIGSDPDNDDYQARALKRPRLVWTLQLHQRFVDAVEQLGLKNAVPKTIMQLMNVDGLTRENVASHLQKYRLQLRKDGGKGDDMEKLVDDDGQKDLEPEQPRMTISEGFK